MARIAKSTIQEVNDRLDAVSVVENYVRLEKKGGRFYGRCPFHKGGQERTPSFKVDPDSKWYYCFGCNKSGSVIDFVMEMDNIGFSEAIRNLAQKLGVKIAYDGESEGDAKDREEELSRKEQLYELYRRVAVSYSHFLTERPEGGKALGYLVSRKISIEMIRHFRIGYAPNERGWLYGFLQKKGYSPEFLDSSGLFSAQYQGSAFFFNRIMFPIADKQGRIVAFGGRAMPGEGDESYKYINTREIDIYKKGQILFGLDLALPEMRKTKTAYIAEGYLDVMALHQAGVASAVGTCGTAFTDEQARVLRNWADSAVLVFDSDEAGQKAAQKSIIICRKNNLACSLVVPGKAANGANLPQEGDSNEILKDPAEILQKFGADKLNIAMKCSILDLEYLVALGKNRYNVATPQGKLKAFTLLFPYFDAIESKIERNESMQFAADEMRAGKDALAKDFERWQRTAGAGRHERAEEPIVEEGVELPIRMNHELFLLMVVSANMNLYPEFRKSVDIREIGDHAARELFVALEECYANDESGIDSLLSRISSGNLRNIVIKRGLTPEFKADSENDARIRMLMEDGIVQVKKLEKNRRRIVAIDAELRLADRNSVNGIEIDYQELLTEKMNLVKEIHSLEGKHDRKLQSGSKGG